MDASPPSSPRKLQPIIRLKQLRQEDSGFRVRISFDEIGVHHDPRICIFNNNIV